jgi:benzoyl-CoA reductase/2-hydroxyglutaryl-CoA dehydratase subunit BcrC/BadD/HgdB
MTTDYKPMWTELGLNLEAHDALLSVLGQMYQDTFLTQKDRPEGMAYLDFVMGEVHGLRIKELVDARAAGRTVVGTFCVYVPEEIVLAADGICVGLCAGAEFGFEEAEKLLPRNTCSLIKSFFGFKLNKVCPYIEAADLIVGETTCDGKKKAYEIFREVQPNLYIMELPQMKQPHDRELLKNEYRRFLEEMEKLSGVKIDAARLKEGIRITNEKRQALHRLAMLRAADPAPISGLDALLIYQVSFYDDPARFTASVNKLCDEIEERVKEGRGVFPAGTPRVIVAGCPMAVPNWKLPAVIESSGAVIVGEESCIGERGLQNLVDGTGETLEDLLDAVVDRYFGIDCAVFTPNEGRLEHVERMVKDYRADGVVHYALQFCSPYVIESYPVEQALIREGVPAVRIETDYSQEDLGQLRTRVEAFVETLGR